jgi:hypothetical protein
MATEQRRIARERRQRKHTKLYIGTTNWALKEV